MLPFEPSEFHSAYIKLKFYKYFGQQVNGAYLENFDFEMKERGKKE